MSGKLISRYRQQFRVHVADYRLAIGTPEQKAAVLRQIEKRSRAAKAGWVKRRAAQGIEAGTATTEGRGPKDESPVAESDAPESRQSGIG